MPKPGKKMTLQDVADALRVSRTTVSNAYNRPDQLSPELRERILAEARKLGYGGPSAAGRLLRRGRSGAFAVLFTERLTYAFSDPFAVRFLDGVAHATAATGMGMLLVPSDLGEAAEPRL